MNEFENTKRLATDQDFKRNYEILVSYSKTPYIGELPLDYGKAKSELMKIWPEINHYLTAEGILATQEKFEAFVDDLLNKR